MSNSTLIPFRNISDFEFVETLGSGTYGCVEKYKEKRTSQEFAIKTARIGTHIKELIIYEKIKRDGAQQYFPECKGFLKNGLIFEVLGQKIYIENREKIISSFKNLLMAVEYLHSNGYCHRDIKPDNMLVRGDTLVLSDLGSYTQPDCFPCQDITTTIPFMDPDLFMSDYTYSSDIWSLGASFAYLLKGIFPTNDTHVRDAIHLVTFLANNPLDQFIESIEDEEFRHLISKMLTSREKRITAREALSLPMFGGMKFEKQIYTKWSSVETEVKGLSDYEISWKNKKLEKQMMLVIQESTPREIFIMPRFIIHLYLEKRISARVLCAAWPIVCMNWSLIKSRSLDPVLYFTCIVYICSHFYDEDPICIDTLGEYCPYGRKILRCSVWDTIRMIGTEIFDYSDPLEAWIIMEKELGRHTTHSEFAKKFVSDKGINKMTSVEIAEKLSME